MATIADVLEHLVAHAPGLYPEGRAEFLAAIGREFRHAAHVEPGPPPDVLLQEVLPGGPEPDVPGEQPGEARL